MASSPTVLAWGYWGWGEATEELVARFDAVESSRGFGPPLLVDVRASRTVRARGFRDDAFERVIGPRRYRWLPGLGNAAVATGTGKMRLVRPEEVPTLLSLVHETAREGRRVIFFCACESPWKAARCHRHLVGTTLLEAAREAGVGLVVQEWPGGEPSDRVVASFDVAPRALAPLRAQKGRWASLGDRRPSAGELGLPVGSLVQLKEGGDELTIAACPPVLVTGAWKLQVMVPPMRSETRGGLVARVRGQRDSLGLEARRV